MAKVRTTVAAALEAAVGTVKNPEGARRNSGDIFFRLHVAQELKRLADSMAKKAWADAVAEGLVESDDKLRANYDIGTHIVAESDCFSVTCKLTEPRKSIDVEAFATKLSKSKYKVPLVYTLKAIEDTKKEGSKVLEKRVLEAV